MKKTAVVNLFIVSLEVLRNKLQKNWTKIVCVIYWAQKKKFFFLQNIKIKKKNHMEQNVSEIYFHI